MLPTGPWYLQVTQGLQVSYIYLLVQRLPFLDRGHFSLKQPTRGTSARSPCTWIFHAPVLKWKCWQSYFESMTTSCCQGFARVGFLKVDMPCFSLWDWAGFLLLKTSHYSTEQKRIHRLPLMLSKPLLSFQLLRKWKIEEFSESAFPM